MASLDVEIKDLRDSFSSYLESKLKAPINYVQAFSLSAIWPKLTLWSNDETRRKLAAIVYDNLRDVVISAQFYYENQLSVSIGEDQIEVEYKDDIFDFFVRISPDGMQLAKRGVDVQTFATWAYQIRDSIQSIFKAVLIAVNKLYTRDLKFTTISFEIKFLLFDFNELSTNNPTNHAVIMTRLIKKFPDRDGQLGDRDMTNLNSLARIDYNVHQWLGEGDKARSAVYKVEAPANRNRSTLWLTFAYSGMSYTSPDGERWRCNPEELLNEAGQFLEFIKDKAVGSFMSSLLDGYSFTTGTQV